MLRSGGSRTADRDHPPAVRIDPARRRARTIVPGPDPSHDRVLPMARRTPTNGAGKPAEDAYPDEGSPFEPAPAQPLVQRAVPVTGRMPGYRVASARRDLFA